MAGHPSGPSVADAVGAIQQAFLSACALDVAVRKPGNVSWASPGHGMAAQQFITSAQVAVPWLCQPGQAVGPRIEAAVRATRDAVGCNTNLGILLLCAPLAQAAEQMVTGPNWPSGRPLDALPDRLPEGPAALPPKAPAARVIGLRQRLAQGLAALSLDDSAAAFRAIALAQPGGLGQADQEDVREPPTLGLRQAMALAADRDRIARQYRDGFAELFDLALPALGAGFVLPPLADAGAPDAAITAAVQRLYLALLASAPDSHIVRKHGQAVAHTVMTAAQAWQARAAGLPGPIGADSGFAAWDESLKSQGINPGTSADLVVATLVLAGCLGPGGPGAGRDWHAS